MSSPDAEPPEGEADGIADPLREDIVAKVGAELGDAMVGHHILPGLDVWIRVTRDAWVDAGHVLRDTLGCRFFDFLSAIDWLPSPFGRDMEAEQDWEVHGREPKDAEPMETGYAGGDTRFQVFARAHSLLENFGVTLKVDLPDDDLTLPTWIPVFAGADWHEREAWEMFGITFVGHPFLQNIYLPSGFEGHPLRKDFPLLARRVKPWPGIVDVEGMPGE